MEVHVVFYTHGGVIHHIRVFEDKEKAQMALEKVKLLTSFSEDEDCDMVSCEVE